MSEDQVNEFEKVQGQTSSLHQEIGALTKKSQNDAINKFKLKFVNKTIAEANQILGNKYKPYSDFDQFSDEELPTTSDVTMILGQYLNCFEKLRTDNIIQKSSWWYWRPENGEPSIRTSPPQKLEK